MDTKRCTRCGVEKPVSDFSTSLSTKSGRRAACTECKRAGDRFASRFSSGMREYATPRQGTALDALLAYGRVIDAASACKLTPRELVLELSELARLAAKRGYAPAHDMTRPTPEGFHVKGVSSYYDASGQLTGQWVKTAIDQEHKIQLMLDAIQRVAEPFRGAHPPTRVPKKTDSDLLCVYPMGDPHLGMYAWHAETDADFDLEVAERNLVTAVDHLVGLAPPAEHALVINLGDFFHSDSKDARTLRSGHALDTDTRWAKVLGVGIRTMRRIVDRALEKHKHVTVICEIGNHDDHSAIMLALCLQQYYERDPRVTVDTSPAKFHWYRFGLNLIGVTHGDTLKAHTLPGVMACDRAKDWRETKHRYWYTGHVHHDSAKEYPGVIVETFRTLASRDAWHHESGYRSGQDMKLDVVHREYGRINRHTVGIRQIWHLEE